MYKSNDQLIANLHIAVPRTKTETDFFAASAFGKQAEFAETWLRKSDAVILTGRLQISKWTDKRGDSHNNPTIMINTIEFQQGKPKDAKE